MPQGKCEKCDEAFAYDEESGLNMQHFEPWADSRRFFMGGVCPACPKCGERYSPPPVKTGIKIRKVYVPIQPKRLTD